MFVANVLKCRPPGNRDPLPQEIDNCQDYLFRQLELIGRRWSARLGNFSTKLLRGDPTGITRLHGRAEIRTIGPRTLRLYPIFHPAAALYTPRCWRRCARTSRGCPSCSRWTPRRSRSPSREPEPVVPEPELAAVAAERPQERAEPERRSAGAPEAPEPPDDRQLGLF